MSKYTNPSGLMDILLEAFMGVLMLMVIFWLITWVISHIWIWVCVGLVLGVGIWLLVRWRRWRDSGW